MHRRQWSVRLVPLILALAGLLLAPAGAALAVTPDAERQAVLVARLEGSADPYSTFAAMPPRDRALVISYLSVTSVVPSAPAQPQAGLVFTMAAGGCWTWTWQRDGKNALGVTLWSYFQEIDWCGNGSTITNTPQRLRWGETYAPFWSWKHIGNQTWGGFGQASYRAWTQGEFKLCATPDVGCVQYSYPWLDMTAWADGRGTGTVGG